jgi:hypothetical protein
MAASNAGLGDIAAATGLASYDDPSRTGLLGVNADDQFHADSTPVMWTTTTL